MQTNIAPDMPDIAAKSSANRRAAALRVDGRSRMARRAKYWRGIFAVACHNTSDALVQAKIARAAQLAALAEEARTAAMVDASADAMRNLTRSEKLASAAAKAIGYFNF
jgi:hypothetical protein